MQSPPTAIAPATAPLNTYLRSTTIIDWQDPAVLEQARQLANKTDGTEGAIAQACFEWVRDRICHSVDYQRNPVTCRASDVLRHGTGYCYAKSHLLAALLRANGIPAGFCYQRLSVDDTGAPYWLHGFNGVYLQEWGWYRMDPRGNRAGVNAQFTPPKEQLAFALNFAEETDFQVILPDPLPIVVEALMTDQTWDELLTNLPDLSPEGANLTDAKY